MSVSLLAFAAGAAGAFALGMGLGGVLVRFRGRGRGGGCGGHAARLSGTRFLRALAAAGRRLVPATPLSLEAFELRLLAAGRPAGLDARALLAAKLAGAAAGGAAGLVWGALLPGRLGLVATLVAAPAGFLAPDLWLRRLARERFQATRRDLPALLDLLRVTVAAGASLPEALARVGAGSRAPLAREWRAIAAQVRVGLPLAAALAGHRRSLPIAEVEAFTGALERAARHGAPLGETLAAQARALRLARRHALQEQAARAGPKMQLVVALLLVPSVLLFVAAALLAALVDAGAGRALLGG